VSSKSQPESALSRQARHLSGYAAIAALVLGLFGLLAGRESAIEAGLITFFALPYAAMILHLNVTAALTPAEKGVWRRELVWSHRSLVAVWAYLFARDLGDRARGFSPYHRDETG
jgi:uncharacterized membrane protein (GlpM family)